MNYINDDIKIDFPVDSALANMMQVCEQDDRDGNYGKYVNDIEYLIDTLAKAEYVDGTITKSQWETIERRYQY